MQWSSASNAGSSHGQNLAAGQSELCPGVNVAGQLYDPDSLLNFYRRLLLFRKQTPALISGDYLPLVEESTEVLAFLRSTPERDSSQTCLVILNLSDQPQNLSFDLNYNTARVLFSSWERQGEVDDLRQVEIAPFEVYIAEVE
jgi:glycosidase